MSKNKKKHLFVCVQCARRQQKSSARGADTPAAIQKHKHTAERTSPGGHKGGDNKHAHTHALCVEIARACVCRCWARARRLPPQSASSLLRRRKRPRTKWESSRSSSTIPGAPLSSSASLLHLLLLLPSPWLSPRDPPLRCPPVMSRLLRVYRRKQSVCCPSFIPSVSVCVCVCVCCLSLSPVRRCRRAIGFLHLTSAHCADSVRIGGAAGEA